MTNSHSVAEATIGDALHLNGREESWRTTDFTTDWATEQDDTLIEETSLVQGLRQLQYQLRNCDALIDNLVQQSQPQSEIVKRVALLTEVVNYLKSKLVADPILESILSGFEIDASYGKTSVEYADMKDAFEKVMERQGSNLERRPGKQPKRTERLWKTFCKSPHQIVPVDKLADEFPGDTDKEKQDNLRTAISKTNVAFRELDLDIEIYHFRGYGIRRFEQSEPVVAFPV